MLCFVERDIYDRGKIVAKKIIQTSYEDASIKARKQRAEARKKDNKIM